MIMARPMYSKNPARIMESPNASVAMACGFLKSFSNQEILRATSTPMSVAPSHTPNAFTATMPIAPQFTPAEAVPPAALAARVAAMMPLPIARTMRPRTSSMTAPAMIETPSSESIFLRSERMRAVMPTEVAVDMMPMYIGAASIQARESGSWAK